MFVLPVFTYAEDELFPVYDEIRHNVDFWKDIYSRYDLSEGVVHDKKDLGIVYEVIGLKNSDSYSNRKKNIKKIKRVKRKFRNILNKLAKGGQASTPEEINVLSLFGDNPSRERFREAARNVRVQLGQRDRFRNGIIRSGAFLTRIKKIFREEGIPSDLAYLAHVESSFNVAAYSKFGAAGIWQFTRSTGKKYMKIDYTVDERRDPITASRAAARFLRDNYRKLASWPLAITAYNHGANGMTRARDKHGDYQNIFKKYDGRAFGFASKNFYSEFLAAREVASQYRKYFGELEMERPWPSRQVKMDGFANAEKIANHLGIDLALIRKFNPALRPPVFEGQKYIPKGYLLRLPNDSQELVALASNIPDDIFSAKQKRSLFYRVRRGDTAGAIARMHGVKVNDLVLANQLNRRATIYAGQNLRIPSLGTEVVTVNEPPIVLSKSYKSQIVESAPNKRVDGITISMLEPPSAVSLAIPVEQPTFPSSPTVVAVIEDFENTSVVAVAEEVRVAMNYPVDEETAVPGGNTVYDGDLLFGIDDLLVEKEEKELQPPLLAQVESVEEVVDDSLLKDINPQLVIGLLQVEKVSSNKGSSYGVITVEAEETLGHYADWLGIPTWMVRRQNSFRYGKAIMVGQKIKIPLQEGIQDVFEEKRYEYHKELIEDFFAAYKVDKIRKYTVQPGDNIWTLCRSEFDLPFWLVRQYNQTLNPSGLKPAQELLIPVVSRRQIDLVAVITRTDVDS